MASYSVWLSSFLRRAFLLTQLTHEPLNWKSFCYGPTQRQVFSTQAGSLRLLLRRSFSPRWYTEGQNIIARCTKEVSWNNKKDTYVCVCVYMRAEEAVNWEDEKAKRSREYTRRRRGEVAFDVIGCSKYTRVKSVALHKILTRGWGTDSAFHFRIRDEYVLLLCYISRKRRIILSSVSNR